MPEPKNATFASNSWIRDLEGLSSSQKVILYALGTRVDKHYQCYPGRTRLIRDTGIKSKSTISSAIAQLEEMGLIKVSARKDKRGGNTSNLYQLMVGAKPYLKTKVDQSKYQAKPMSGPKLSIVSSHSTDPLLIDKHIDEIGTSLTEVQGDEYLLYSKEGQEDFPLMRKYLRDKLTQKAMVGFWWELVNHYHPGIYTPNKNLTKFQHSALIEWRDITQDSRLTLGILEICVSRWTEFNAYCRNRDHVYAKPPQTPSPTWLLKQSDSCWNFALGISEGLNFHYLNNVA